MWLILPLFAIAGLLMFVLATREDIKKVGLVMFFCALLWILNAFEPAFARMM
jgi:hypothetical protein